MKKEHNIAAPRKSIRIYKPNRPAVAEGAISTNGVDIPNHLQATAILNNMYTSSEALHDTPPRDSIKIENAVPFDLTSMTIEERDAFEKEGLELFGTIINEEKHNYESRSFPEVSIAAEQKAEFTAQLKRTATCFEKAFNEVLTWFVKIRDEKRLRMYFQAVSLSFHPRESLGTIQNVYMYLSRVADSYHSVSIFCPNLLILGNYKRSRTHSR